MAQMTTVPVRTRGFYLAGKWLEEGKPVEIRAPYDGTPLATVFQGNADHVERAIQSAVRAFGSTRRLPWWPSYQVSFTGGNLPCVPLRAGNSYTVIVALGYDAWLNGVESVSTLVG